MANVMTVGLTRTMKNAPLVATALIAELGQPALTHASMLKTAYATTAGSALSITTVLIAATAQIAAIG